VRRVAAASLVAVLLALAWAATAAAEGQALSLRGIDFPETLAGYKRGKVQVATRSGKQQGTSVDYLGSGLAARVFMYGVRAADQADADENALRREFKDMVAAEQKEAQRHGAANISVRGMRQLRGADGREHFMEAEMHLTGGKERRVVYLYLANFQGQFVKVVMGGQTRFSGSNAGRPFIRSLTDLLWPTGGAAQPAGTAP